ncbi:MAG: alpha/beta hydrolase [Sphingobacteriaceae bacterium]|nr:alpha/beta hydrolase [Cytophagaceae bacterium]
MQVVIEQFQAFGTPPLPTLSPAQARMTPSVTDAVKTLLAKNGREPNEPNLTVSQRVVPGGPMGAPQGILLRIYTPQGQTGALPVIVYYHGGGWVIAGLNTYEPSAKALADKAGAIVVSVDYRQAPENKFPAAHEDAYAAYKWVKENAATINGDPAKVAVAGESAGGNMAAAVCILARERGLALPVHQLLVYPVANNDLTTASYNAYANAVPLNRPAVEWFVANYFNSPADGDNRLISLVDVADLKGLPSATIIGAEIDPLQTEGKLLSDRFQQAGVAVTYQLYTGVTHEFFGTHDLVPEAGQAQDLAATELKKAFGTGN